MVVHKLDVVDKVYIDMHVGTKLATTRCGKQMFINASGESERFDEMWKNVTCQRCLKLKLKNKII